jgi:NAD(P)-dependent dehydrogenase (short-subunit alcohol dehydrogenase family)
MRMQQDRTQPPDATTMFSLHGTVAIVTGATSGIGLATATALAQAGASTVLAGLADQEPGQVAEQLAQRSLSTVGITCDVTDSDQLANLADFTLDRYGRIDTVFCNAGIALDAGPLLKSTDAQLDRMFDIHVRSVLRLCNLAYPNMAARGSGSIIIMSSLSGLRGNKLLALYGITKAANAELARNLAVQWGPAGIRVNAISPGVIDTDFARPITGDQGLAAARLAKTPLGRFGEPHHVAGTVVWLASEAGAFVSGQNIVVDGGTMASD